MGSNFTTVLQICAAANENLKRQGKADRIHVSHVGNRINIQQIKPDGDKLAVLWQVSVQRAEIFLTGFNTAFQFK